MKTQKQNDGFTLVELIVVIAILAILAAVAIPAYNGYIEKANKAADEQLLAAVNKAYASACLENGIDYTEFTEKEAQIRLPKGKISFQSVKPYAIAGNFEAYMEGNADAEFKVFKSLQWDAEENKFEVEEMASYKFKNKDYFFFQSDIDAYKNSNFYDIGVEDTLALMDTLIDTVIDATYEDETGTKGAIASLKADSKFEAFLIENGLDPTVNDQVATGLAFYAAEKMASIDPNAVAAAMTGDASVDIDNMYKVISGNDNPTYSEKAVSAAIMYAMTAGYAKSEFAPEGTELPTGTDEIASTVQLAGYLGDYYQQEGFKQYLASATAAEDMAGLAGVLNTLDTNDENALGIVKDGDYKFDQRNMKKLIEGLLGD